MREVKRECSWFIDHLLAYWPGASGRLLRRWVIRRRFKRAGQNVSSEIGVEIVGAENISVGDNILIMRHSSLRADDGVVEMGSNISINSNSCVHASNKGRIIIGNYVMIGQNAVLRASDHAHDRVDVPIVCQGHTGGEIVIEDDVWIGANVVVTRNTRIGAHSIVAAGAVVATDVEPYSIVGGVPARVLARRM